MESNLSVLLISDQTLLVEQIRQLLANLSQDIRVVESVDAFEDEFSHDLDLCMVDTARATEAAFELTTRLRAVQPRAGLICITGPHQSERLQALQCGADQVMAQPLDEQEFTAMLRNMLHRLRLRPMPIKSGLLNGTTSPLELSSQQRSLCGPSAEIALTHTEYLLLQSFARAKDRALELWQIYDLLGKNEQTLQKPALEAQIYRIRKKLRDAGAGNQALKAVRLKGYQLCVAIWIS